MSLREAAQQALEALIWTTGSADFGEGGKAHEGALNLLFPAITILRTALADDRSDDTGKTADHFADADKMVVTINEMETVEPVAYSYTDARGRTVLVSTNTAPYEDAKPLYTAPPGIVARAVATERDRIAAWVEDMCVGLDAKTIANGIRNNGNDDIRAFEVKK